MIDARFRFWAGQRLVEDIRLRPDDDSAVLSAIGARHARWAGIADASGQVWFVEVAFDDGEHVRFGTDQGGMVLPVEVGRERLAEALEKRMGGR
jgi:hypothetical protein